MKEITTAELFREECPLIDKLLRESRYPWEIIPKIKEYATALTLHGIAGYTLLKDGVLVGEGVTIHPSAVIEGPCIIGSYTEVRPNAYIRGSVIIGERCVIGNSTELKNSVLMDRVQVPHYNYVGDSVLGCGSHMGAGAVCSNLKSDKSRVIIHADEDIDTGLVKLGAILADGAEIGCGCVLNPGTVVGRNTSVYPLTLTRGVYPPDSIVKDTHTVVKRKNDR